MIAEDVDDVDDDDDDDDDVAEEEEALELEEDDDDVPARLELPPPFRLVRALRSMIV